MTLLVTPDGANRLPTPCHGSGKARTWVGGMSSKVMSEMGGRLRCLPSIRSSMFLAASCMRLGSCFQLISCSSRCFTPSSPCTDWQWHEKPAL